MKREEGLPAGDPHGGGPAPTAAPGGRIVPLSICRALLLASTDLFLTAVEGKGAAAAKHGRPVLCYYQTKLGSR